MNKDTIQRIKGLYLRYDHGSGIEIRRELSSINPIRYGFVIKKNGRITTYLGKNKIYRIMETL